jgi:hypothetical protein
VSNNLNDTMADNIETMKKNTETLTLIEEVGLEVNAEKTKYRLLCCLTTRMQGIIVTDFLKMWHGSNTLKILGSNALCNFEV